MQPHALPPAACSTCSCRLLRSSTGRMVTRRHGMVGPILPLSVISTKLSSSPRELMSISPRSWPPSLLPAWLPEDEALAGAALLASCWLSDSGVRSEATALLLALHGVVLGRTVNAARLPPLRLSRRWKCSAPGLRLVDAFGPAYKSYESNRRLRHAIHVDKVPTQCAGRPCKQTLQADRPCKQNDIQQQIDTIASQTRLSNAFGSLSVV
jgi:hypothetical protein